MDDLQYGTRNKRGDWSPNDPAQIAPIWRLPQPWPVLRHFIGEYIWPWNAFHFVVTLFYWFVIIPDVSELQSWSWGLALKLYLTNSIGIFLLYGGVEFVYYLKRRQGTRFKFNHKFPADHPSEVFWFSSQYKDNIIRCFLVTIPLWTLCQMIILWAWANSWGNWVTWADHPIWIVFMLFMAPAIHEIHFFFIHRLIHTPWLYKYVHSVHHNSVNPSPWTSLSMHPVEGFLYFSEMFWYILIPSHPFNAFFAGNSEGYGAINGHIGFDKLEVNEDKAINSHAYVHYLHHKYFEVNYGGDGLIPLDKWFGTWHDGSKEGEAQMQARFKAKKDKLNAKQRELEEKQRAEAG